jgi:putative transposase
MSERLLGAKRIGRPVGDAAFIATLDRRDGMALAPARRGRKPKNDPDGE